jgi:Putative beta-barrel porin-2, OmpL-like. bbp2
MTRTLGLSRRFVVPPLAVLLLAALPVLGEEPKPEPEASPSATAEPATTDPAPTEPTRVVVGGFVDIYYGYNFNKVGPRLRTFDIQHNTFSLSMAEVNLEKKVSPESRVGFRTDLDFGKSASIVSSFEPETVDQQIYENIQQAYVSLLTGKVQWDVGKFVTPIGAEVIESQDNWNYTRSVLFGYAIPFYHVGVRATLPVNDKFTVNAFLLNGWNNDSAADGVQTGAFALTWKPNDKVTWILNDIVGKDTPGSNETRNLFDTTFTLNVNPKLSLMANFDYGTEGDVKWWGIAGYAKLQATTNWDIVGRFEYLDDTQGSFMTFGTTAQTLTITSDYFLVGALRARIDYRTDFAAQPIFPSSSGVDKKTQTTLTVGLVYGFGGKI